MFAHIYILSAVVQKYATECRKVLLSCIRMQTESSFSFLSSEAKIVHKSHRLET